MSENGRLKIESMKHRCTPEEWQARVDLAACYRLVDIYGMSDMMANHISSSVPGQEGAFLINAYGMMYEEITASSLIKIDIHGNILDKPDFGDLNYGINKAGYVIHSAIHEARHEVKCVIHTHSWASMAVTPCSMPRSEWPSRKEGRISLWMIRADRQSVSTGSRP